jgi:hypothetical protein
VVVVSRYDDVSISDNLTTLFKKKKKQANRGSAVGAVA